MSIVSFVEFFVEAYANPVQYLLGNLLNQGPHKSAKKL